MRIFVTGAAGFIGYHLCEKLLKEGHSVLGLDNLNDYYDPELKFARLNELGIERKAAEIFENISASSIHGNKFKFIRLNLEDRKNLPELFEKFNFKVVCNLAAQGGVRYSLENPEAYIDSNVVGFLNILECCRHHRIRHFLYASSSSVYGENKNVPFLEDDNVDNPISLYAATKKSNELMAYAYSHLYGLPTSGLRFFTVYGPWGRPDMAIYLFTKAIIDREVIKVFNNGNMSRDFTFIDDIISGIEIVMNNPPDRQEGKPLYRLFNIGNGFPQSLSDFILAIEQVLGLQAEKEYLPMQPGDVSQTWASIGELEKFGYSAKIQIDEGVSKFVDWFKQYHAKKF